MILKTFGLIMIGFAVLQLIQIIRLELKHRRIIKFYHLRLRLIRIREQMKPEEIARTKINDLICILPN